MNVGSLYTTSNVNTPSLQSSATAIASNPARIAWTIQNQGTNTLYVLLGSGASTTVFHVALKGATVANDGTGGSIAQEAGAIYTGIITVAGTTPSYTVTEMAP